MKLRGIEGYHGIVHTSITQAFKGNISIAKSIFPFSRMVILCFVQFCKSPGDIVTSGADFPTHRHRYTHAEGFEI
jgi:hypothetical protein